MALEASADALRNVANAVYAWLGQLELDYSAAFGENEGVPSGFLDLTRHAIMRINESPHRDVQSPLNQLIAQGFVSPAHATAMQDTTTSQLYNRLPTPYVLFKVSEDIQLVTELMQPDFVRIPVPTDGGVQYFRAPKRYRADFTATFVFTKRYTWHYISTWLLGRFNNVGGVNSTYLDVQYPKPWGTQLTVMEFEGVSDGSDFEADETDTRKFRKTLTASIEFLIHDTTGVVDDNGDPVIVPLVDSISGKVVYGSDASRKLGLVQAGDTVLSVDPVWRVTLDVVNPRKTLLHNADALDVVSNATGRNPAVIDVAANGSVETAPMLMAAGRYIEILCDTTASDGVVPIVSVVHRNTAEPYSETVVQTNVTGKKISTCAFSGAYVSVRYTLPSAARLAIDSLRVVDIPTTNLVASGDRNPTTLPHTVNLTVSANRRHVLRYVVSGTGTVTATVYADGTQATVLATKSGSAGEHTLSFASAGTAPVVVFTATGSPTVREILVAFVEVSPL